MEPMLRGMHDEAVALVSSHYAVERHQIASVLADVDGRRFHGLHIEAMVGRASLCAEAVALGNAVMGRAGSLRALVTVRHPKPTEDGITRVVPPCGLCRELLLDYAPGLVVAVPTDEGLVGIELANLLPHKYRGTKWST